MPTTEELEQQALTAIAAATSIDQLTTIDAATDAVAQALEKRKTELATLAAPAVQPAVEGTELNPVMVGVSRTTPTATEVALGAATSVGAPTQEPPAGAVQPGPIPAPEATAKEEVLAPPAEEVEAVTKEVAAVAPVTATTVEPLYRIDAAGTVDVFPTQAAFDAHILGLASLISQDPQRYLSARSR